MAALVASLRLDRPRTEGLRTLDDADWRSLLAISDRMHVTLALASRHRGIVPEWVRERLAPHTARQWRRWCGAGAPRPVAAPTRGGAATGSTGGRGDRVTR